MTQMRRCTVMALAWTIAAASAAKAQAGPATQPVLPANLAATRAALARYQDPIAAVHDGYLSTLACVEYPRGGVGMGEMAYKPGAMGVHFINPTFIGPTLDSLKPQVLIYEPVGDRLHLVAAEWFVPTALAKEAPAIFGRRLDGPMEGHAPVLPAEMHHWDLHVWLWKTNPNGVMDPTNSTVQCPESPYSFHEAAVHMVKP
jgi:hypothetical protein